MQNVVAKTRMRQNSVMNVAASLRVEVYGTGNELLIWVDDNGASYIQ